MANNNSILTGIYSGLANTYSQLAAQYPNGLTLDNLKESWKDNTKVNAYNSSFASYLQNNFNTIDSDHDGIITSEEMQNLTNMISAKGLTKNELMQLCASGTSGLSQDTINNILENFDEMDANHDGRITSSEISAYSMNASRLEKEDEFANRAATNMSVFYGDDSSASQETSSLLSYKYKNNKS